ncbi:MAG: HAD family hydrolase [Rickettsiales endosymbiont of Dermacentor nuttalli]
MNGNFLPKPKAILFDWDNTLADTWILLKQASEHMLEQMDIIPTPEITNKLYTHKSMRELLPEIFGVRWQEAAHIYQAAYRKLRENNLSLLPLAKEVLLFLQNNPQIHVGIVSNKVGTSLREEVSLLELNHFFTKLIGSQDTTEDKPSVMPVLAALEGSNIEIGQDVWFIGDSIIDIQCAHNANCIPILYGNNLKSSVDCNPSVHVKNHQEFLDILHYILR